MCFNEILDETRKVDENTSIDDIADDIVAKANGKKLSIDTIVKMIGKENEDVLDAVVSRLEAKGVVAEKQVEDEFKGLDNKKKKRVPDVSPSVFKRKEKEKDKYKFRGWGDGIFTDMKGK